MKRLITIFFLPILAMTGCHFETFEFDQDFNVDNSILFIGRTESVAIPADGLTPVELEVRLMKVDEEKRKVTLTTPEGKFSNGEKSMVVELTEFDEERAVFVELVTLTSSTNRGKVIVEAAIDDIKSTVELEFEEVDFSITPDTSGDLEADGVTAVPVTVSLIPDLRPTDFKKRAISLTVSGGTFAGGAITLDVAFKGESSKSVNVTTSTTVTTVKVTGKFMDVEKVETFTSRKAFPETLKLSGEDVFMLDSAGTKFKLIAVVDRKDGTPSKGHAVNFVIPATDAMGNAVDATFQQVTTTDPSGVATAVFTLLDSISPGDLTFSANMLNESSNTITATVVVRVLPSD